MAKLPTIRLALLHKHIGKDGRQALYLSYAYQGRTNTLSMGMRIAAQEWDDRRQRIKGNGVLESQLNQDLKERLARAEGIVADLLREKIAPTFLAWRRRYTSGDGDAGQSSILLVRDGMELMAQRSALHEIEEGTANVYASALRSFLTHLGDVPISNLSRAQLASWKAKLIEEDSGADNRANQYMKFVQAVFKALCRAHDLDVPNVFRNLPIRVTRISEKRTISKEEMAVIERYYASLDRAHPDREILRRFLICRRSLRFVDTTELRRENFVRVMDPISQQEFFMLEKRAHKTKKAIFAPLLQEDLELLEWRDDGFLFEPITIKWFNSRLKQITKRLIGRPITSHFGRHFAGDSMAASNMEASSIQAVLGVSSAKITQIYASKNKFQILREFYNMSMAYQPISFNQSDLEIQRVVKEACWKLIENSGLNREALANQLGVTTRNMYRIYKPDDPEGRQIEILHIAKLCRILGKNLELPPMGPRNSAKKDAPD